MAAITTFLAGAALTGASRLGSAGSSLGRSWTAFKDGALGHNETEPPARMPAPVIQIPRPVIPAVPSTESVRSTHGLDGIVHILTCGSVDDGKSTLIGRLLWDAGEVPEDTRASMERTAAAAGEDVDYSLLLDGLLAEREQGITIDIAWRSFDADPTGANPRRFVVIDSPGHEQYTRNMASGASHADVAVVLVDARAGIKPQTRRHVAILDLVGVAHVVLAVNKMDLAGWSQERFAEIAADFDALVRGFAFASVHAIPLSAKRGANITARAPEMPWYEGPTLLACLGAVPSRRTASSAAFRFPVQSIVRGAQDFRGLAGRITSGTVRAGDAVRDTLTGREARIARIVTMDGDLDTAAAGRSVVLQLDRDIDVGRGAVLALPEAMPTVTRQLDVRLVWLADTGLSALGGLLLRTATDLVPVAHIDVSSRLDLETMQAAKAHTCVTNDIVTAHIALSRSVALDRFQDGPQTGAFVLVDALTGTTVAGGVVTAVKPHAPLASGKTFKLTYALLAQTVCADLPKGKRAEPEFRRRAQEVAFLLSAAGAEVDMEEFEDGGGI